MILLLFFIHICYGLIAYDCSHPKLNMTTIAVNQVPECNYASTSKNVSNEEIQLVQLSNSYPIHVYQCKVVIHRNIMYCGMHSHNSITRGGLFEYIKELSKDECMHLQLTGSISIGQYTNIVDIPRNGSKTIHTVFGGGLDYDGTCKGGFYSDITGTYSGVVVTGYVKVTITDYEATADTLNNKIKLRSGLTGSLTHNVLMDIDAGYTFWSVSDVAQCDERLHTVLYQGIATKIIENNITSYIVEHGKKIFGLSTTGYYTQCQVKAYITEHPKLIIVPKSEYGFYFKMQNSIDTSKLDLMTYVNSKILMLEKHIGSTIENIYEEISMQKCKLERKSLNNLRSLALTNPQLFAYTYMDKPGYTAISAGEVIHLMKCVPVDVKVRRTDICYNELPVNNTNKEMFMIPNSRLLQEYGTEIDCDTLLAPQYLLEDGWYSITDRLYPIRTPVTLTPEPMKMWKYINIKNLAISGIYTYDETERLQDRIMYPYERSAINNIITRGVSHESINLQGININRIFTEQSFDAMKDKLIEKVWGWLSVFGNISAGVIGLYMVGKTIKFLIDSIIHGTILYDLYGWSYMLIGSIWDSVTTYLIQRKQANTKETNHEFQELIHPQSNSIDKQESNDTRGSVNISDLNNIPLQNSTDNNLEIIDNHKIYIPNHMRKK